MGEKTGVLRGGGLCRQRTEEKQIKQEGVQEREKSTKSDFKWETDKKKWTVRTLRAWHPISATTGCTLQLSGVSF